MYIGYCTVSYSDISEVFHKALNERKRVREGSERYFHTNNLKRTACDKVSACAEACLCNARIPFRHLRTVGKLYFTAELCFNTERIVYTNAEYTAAVDVSVNICIPFRFLQNDTVIVFVLLQRFVRIFTLAYINGYIRARLHSYISRHYPKYHNRCCHAECQLCSDTSAAAEHYNIMRTFRCAVRFGGGYGQITKVYVNTQHKTERPLRSTEHCIAS